MAKCKKCEIKLTKEYDRVFEILGKDVGPYCETCWSTLKTCSECKTTGVWEEDINYFGEGIFLCNKCKTDKVKMCKGCGDERIMFDNPYTNDLCQRCYEELFVCQVCDKLHLKPMEWSGYWVDHNISTKMQLSYPGVYSKYNNTICTGCFNDIKHRFKKLSVHTCGRCSQKFNNPVTAIKSGKLITDFCPTCFENYHFECGHCSDVTVRNDYTIYYRNPETGKKDSICGKCARMYYHCAGCQKTYYKKDNPCTTNQLGLHLCSTCTEHKICTACGRYVPPDKISNGTQICNNCLGNLRQCDDCGKPSLECRSHSEVSGGRYCRTCLSKRGYGHIWNYMHKPKTIAFGTGDALIVGLENEVCCRPKLNRFKVLGGIIKHYDEAFLLAKDDSSVYNGFEIVTQPMTFDYFQSINWKHMFPKGKLLSAKEVYDINHTENGKTQQFAGFHIHLSKRHFTTFHLYKFINFLYANHKFAEEVAEREANHFCPNFAHYKQVKNSSKDKFTTGDRGFIYMPKNKNTKTVELRFFAACHTEEMFQKNVEFTQSIFEFTFLSNKRDAESIKLYRDYVKENAERFPHLTKFLKGVK